MVRRLGWVIFGLTCACALAEGVLLLTAGTYGNVIRFLPSLAVTDEQLRDALQVLDEAFTAAG